MSTNVLERKNYYKLQAANYKLQATNCKLQYQTNKLQGGILKSLFFTRKTHDLQT